jgi:exosortase/archaeosortase family protein
LVKQACAGLGSLVTLMALGLLYVHLTQPSSRGRNVALILSIIPIALVANLLRVIILVLLTYHFGDAVAQSFAHDLAGIVTFALSMLGLVAFDHLLSRHHARL